MRSIQEGVRSKAAIAGLALAAALAASACGGGNKAGACDFPTDGLCIDYGSLSSSELDTAKTQLCLPNSGSWISGSCSTSNRLGTCAILAGSETRLVRVYVASGASASQAQQACVDGTIGNGVAGTWTNG